MRKFLVNFLCAFIPGKQNRKTVRNKLLCKKHNTNLNNFYNDSVEINKNINKNIDQKFSILNLLNKNNNVKQTNFKNNNFILFNYLYQKHAYTSSTGYVNLGDYVQTLAVKNVLDNISENNNYIYFDRDNMSNYYGENAICIMQGWFSHGYNFIPNNKILPIFIGTHFISQIQTFLEQFLIYNRDYFQNREIGCRDLHTLNFCRANGIKSYFSRCLTLTFSKRRKSNKQNKIFIVNVNDNLIKCMPESITEKAIIINQRGIKETEDKKIIQNWSDYYNDTENLLKRYKDEAKLVITSALHCASPCLAMGIPTILFTDANKEEQKTRFTALSGLINIYTLKDIKDNNVVYDFKAPDIEDLKEYLIKNVELSIKKELGEKINLEELENIRDNIANYKVNGINFNI